VRGHIRTVKPELFSDEALWDMSQETGLPLLQAFVGIWCFADREGRFEWRARALKSLILPYWEGDFARVLDALERGRYVVRYEVDGKAYGYVRSWHKHQRPNHREEASALPEPPVTTPCSPRDDAASTARSPVSGSARGERKGTEGNGTEGSAAPARGERPPPSSPEAVTEIRRVDPRIGSGGVARTVTMPGPEPSESYLAHCVGAGVSPDQARSTWSHYFGAGLPQGGVERLDWWLCQRAKERATSQARASPRANAGPPPPKGKPAAQGIAEWRAQEAELARQADIEMGRVPRGGAG
jgi:hypothetical protein